MRKFIRDIDAALGIAVPLPIGRYERLFFHAGALEVATGEAITAKILITLNGDTIHNNIPLIDYVDINNIFRGMPTWDVTTGATDTTEVAVYAPFSFPKVPNALDVDKNDIFTIYFDKGNLISGTLSVYSVLSSETPENFIPKLIKLDLTQAGTAVFRIKEPNPLWLLCKPRAVTDKILVTKNDILEENASADQLIRQTEIDNRIEAGTLTKFLVDLAPNKRISEVLTDDVELSIEHGAEGSSSVTVFHCLFNAERMDISASKQAVEIVSKVEKAMLAHPDLARTIETITGIRNLQLSRRRRDSGEAGVAGDIRKPKHIPGEW